MHLYKTLTICLHNGTKSIVYNFSVQSLGIPRMFRPKDHGIIRTYRHS